jgi:GNAT superfamily N-acetyltransferase
MPDYRMRSMDRSELGEIYEHIVRDFSEGEYAPYDVLYEQLEEGTQEGLVFCEGNKDMAYAICAAGNDNEFVLISLLAVFEEYRGRGVGSVFLRALCEKYADKQGILVEVEMPEFSESPEDHNSRIKRIRYYEKEGFYIIPEIEYSIWDVPMHIMAKPVFASKETIDEGIGQFIYGIYLKLMGKRFIHQLKIRKLG